MSNKTKDQQLLDYRKANKTRRVKILANAGFAGEAEYLAFLMGPDPIADEKPLIHNVHIIDISYSMKGAKLASALQGINDEVTELKKSTDVDFIQSVVEFSEEQHIKNVIWRQPIATTPVYYSDPISGTALYQAVGQTLQLLRQSKLPGEKVLVKIFTDGEENSSRGEFRNPTVLSKLIKQCEEEDFTITFIGTDRDIRTVVNHLSIDTSNTFAHDNTARGIYLASNERIGATLSYSNKVLRKEKVTKGFYKTIKED
jgi:hypothetical protein